jgi:hypothetical protein
MMRDNRGSLPFWSIPISSVLGIRIQINLLFFLLPPALCLWFGLRLGCSISALLFFSAVIHECARIIVCNWHGEPPTQSILWPAGGLMTASRPRTRVLGAIAGMTANLLICLLTAYPLYQSGRLGTALDPMLLDEFQLGQSPGTNIIYLLFAINWTLTLVNLLPLLPMTSGILFKELAHKIFNEDNGEIIWLRSSWCLATILLLTGLTLELTMVVAIASVSMLAIMMQSQVVTRFEPEPKETFLGYDFSEGYTSLNRDSAPPKPESLVQRWKDKREEQRRIREAELDLEVSENLDRILAQVHEDGMDSLNQNDRKLLKRASERFRTRETLPKISKLD